MSFLPVTSRRGTTGGAPAAATLTAGVGISIANAAGSITISNTGVGPVWNLISGNLTLVVDNGYICVAPGGNLLLDLPAVSPVGSTIEVALDGATSWTIRQAGAQCIQVGDVTTTVGPGGSLSSTAQGDSIKLVCRTADTLWIVLYMIGNLTVV